MLKHMLKYGKNITTIMTLFMIACADVKTTHSGTVGVERKQYIAVDPQALSQQSAQMYIKEVQTARAKGLLNTDPKLYQRVQKITQKLIPQTVVFRPDARNWKWEVNVVNQNEPNAYCLPGGKIIVYSGLVTQLKASDGELAAVIGHEIAHALREHAAERISVAQRNQTIAGLGATLLGKQTGYDFSNIANLGANIFFNLPNNRTQETEADRIGLELMARAGYNPNDAISLWKKMIADGDNSAAWMSTHPSGSQRIADLTALMPTAMSVYKKSID